MYNYDMNDEEFEEACLLVQEYLDAREQKDYIKSDALRYQIEKAGFVPPKYDHWLPVFEHREHRNERLNKRDDFKKHLLGY